MRTLNLVRGKSLTIITPDGKISLSVTDHYGRDPETLVYFSRDRRCTKVVALNDLIAANLDKPTP